MSAINDYRLAEEHPADHRFKQAEGQPEGVCECGWISPDAKCPGCGGSLREHLNRPPDFTVIITGNSIIIFPKGILN